LANFAQNILRAFPFNILLQLCCELSSQQCFEQKMLNGNGALDTIVP
jgi:hypothetical protein